MKIQLSSSVKIMYRDVCLEYSKISLTSTNAIPGRAQLSVVGIWPFCNIIQLQLQRTATATSLTTYSITNSS